MVLFIGQWQLHFKSLFSPLFNYMQQYQIHGTSARYIFVLGQEGSGPYPVQQ